jgi:hypothetical protein
MTDKETEVEQFIRRWEVSGAAERANHQLFISELCDLLGVPHPDPATPDNSQNAYVFERAVTFKYGDGSTSTGFIDLYKRGCFVLEAIEIHRQRGEFEQAMALIDFDWQPDSLQMAEYQRDLIAQKDMMLRSILLKRFSRKRMSF